jgi:hypothetical protein
VTTAPGSNTIDALLADLAGEMVRQDGFHPSGYPATRDGVFLGITTAVHELDREAIDAWRSERCPCPTPLCGHATWTETRAELLQAAAVIMRTVRSITAVATAAATAGGLQVHDVIGRNAPRVPDEVDAFEDDQGDLWERPVDEAEATDEEGNRYDFITRGYRGDGIAGYMGNGPVEHMHWPLTVVRVRAT